MPITTSPDYNVYINGTKLNPQPDFNGGLKWGLQDIQDADAGRAEDGGMIFTLVAHKRKLWLTFSNITIAQAQGILATMPEGDANKYFPVKYWDFQDGAQKTVTVYKGDRQVEWYSYVHGPFQIKQLTFNLIER